MEIALIGGGGAAALAADLALAGHSARLAAWSGEEAAFAEIASSGRISLTGDAAQTISGRLGDAAVPVLQLADAVSGAALVVAEFDPDVTEVRLGQLAPHLRDGQVVHANTYAYWPALRFAPILARHGKAESVTVTEGIAPFGTGTLAGATATALWLRRKLPVAAFPASRSAAAFATLGSVFPALRPVENVLATGLANLNMVVHPGIGLLSLGWFDRAAADGGLVSFYRGGNTAAASRLTHALDAERKRVAEAYGVAWSPVTDYLRDLYGSEGATFQEAVQNTGFYRSLPDHAPNLGVDWLRNDIPHAHQPLVALADHAGVAVPLQKGLAAIFAAATGDDLAARGIGLPELGLSGLDVGAIRHLVDAGHTA